MFGISTSERIAHKVESQFKPHWLTSNRPSNDVARPTPALPLYEWLAGKNVPEILAVETVKNQIKANELKDWCKAVAPVNDVLREINDIQVSPELANSILEAVRYFDIQRANSEFEQHIRTVVGSVSQYIQGQIERVVKSLPNGQRIFDEIADNSLYVLCLEKNGDDDYELSMESNGFFEHYYADVGSVPEKYRPYYAFLLHRLMMGSFGELQINVIEYYGSVDAVSVGRAGIISRFLKKLRVCDSEGEIQSVLKAYGRCKTIDNFLVEVEEVCSWGECIREMLVNDHESALNCLEEGFELMEYAVKYKSLMDYGDVTLDSLLSAEDDGSEYMALFKAIWEVFSGLPECNSAIMLKDERTPFGVIISPLGEREITDEVERRLQNLYEGYCNNCEDSEAWIIDLKNPDWKKYVSNCALSMALVIAMITGVGNIQKVA